MPNIEIYSQKDDMYRRVMIATRDLPYPLKIDIVITDFKMVGCYNRMGKLQPFVRVCSTDKAEIDAVVEVLQPLGYDIETLVLTGFYGKK